MCVHAVSSAQTSRGPEKMDMYVCKCHTVCIMSFICPHLTNECHKQTRSGWRGAPKGCLEPLTKGAATGGCRAVRDFVCVRASSSDRKKRWVRLSDITDPILRTMCWPTRI